MGMMLKYKLQYPSHMMEILAYNLMKSVTYNKLLEATSKTAEIDKNNGSQRCSLRQESVRRVSLTAVSLRPQFKDEMKIVSNEREEGISDKGVAGTATYTKLHSHSFAKVDSTQKKTLHNSSSHILGNTKPFFILCCH